MDGGQGLKFKPWPFSSQEFHIVAFFCLHLWMSRLWTLCIVTQH